ncbi:MAG: aminotransferase class V-fold PLP-dependent enzyme [Acidobacteria bacterium]|nr:aminotransferase class V-fold PLP-dependent enzyme [Acidobacteriota bacterium]
MNRRQLITGIAASAGAAVRDWAAVRADFPAAQTQAFLNPAGYCPIGTPMAEAVKRYVTHLTRGGSGEDPAVPESKRLFAKLVNCADSEVSIIPSTLAGENIIAAGMGLHNGRGNVVTDELHYHGGLYLYRSLEQAGLQVRIVKQKEWRTDPADIAAAVDRNTRLVAITLVSNINGFQHDAAKVSSVAHASGAYLYADIVQAAGCVPVDLRGSGIDFAAASGYKWLMGMRGFGFLYVRTGLEDRVLKRTQFGDRQYTDFEYHRFPGSPPGPAPYSWKPVSDGRRYETGNVNEAGAACAVESLRYILNLGIGRMQEHARPLIEKVRKEVAARGYPCITPPGEPAPVAAFLVEQPEALTAKLKKANVNAKVKWKQLRVSIAAFNNGEDVERLVEAL